MPVNSITVARLRFDAVRAAAGEAMRQLVEAGITEKEAVECVAQMAVELANACDIRAIRRGL